MVGEFPDDRRRGHQATCMRTRRDMVESEETWADRNRRHYGRSPVVPGLKIDPKTGFKLLRSIRHLDRYRLIIPAECSTARNVRSCRNPRRAADCLYPKPSQETGDLEIGNRPHQSSLALTIRHSVGRCVMIKQHPENDPANDSPRVDDSVGVTVCRVDLNSATPAPSAKSADR